MLGVFCKFILWGFLVNYWLYCNVIILVFLILCLFFKMKYLFFNYFNYLRVSVKKGRLFDGI